MSTNVSWKEPLTVSAPGKVLLVGGYLVLDQDYTCSVFGLDARIHITIQKAQTDDLHSLPFVTVRSPQFVDAEWTYDYWLRPDSGTGLSQRGSRTKYSSPFIENAIAYAWTYVTTVADDIAKTPFRITILADDDYYSKATSSSFGKKGKFSVFDVTLSEVHKTGLGSSAALVTALVATILCYFVPQKIKLDTDLIDVEGLKIIHNIAQAAHCAAQGKVGSGFDVAAAVYGSCIYRRFSPNILDRNTSQSFTSYLEHIAEGREWDVKIEKHGIGMPKHTRLVLCDVDCGSKTPGMVKKVLAWRRQNHDKAAELWNRLQAANDELTLTMYKYSQANEDDPDYDNLRDQFRRIRGYIREMSAESGVPIEPPEQTALLDACAEVDGVLGGVVPGAGGYDAVSLLVKDNEKAMRALRERLDEWNANLDNRRDRGIMGNVGILGVKQDMQGIRIEDAAELEAWLF